MCDSYTYARVCDVQLKRDARGGSGTRTTYLARKVQHKLEKKVIWNLWCTSYSHFTQANQLISTDIFEHFWSVYWIRKEEENYQNIPIFFMLERIVIQTIVKERYGAVKKKMSKKYGGKYKGQLFYLTYKGNFFLFQAVQ